jgi:queuine tRNA-ribosyltransferase
MSKFKITHKSAGARRGFLKTAHGEVETPVFMPVGTKGTVKAMLPEELENIGFEIILGNTYHLHLRPGEALIKDLGGLHKFMNWKRSILTDSGGFQVFSLAKLRKISEEGVKFQSHYDGASCFLSPETSMQIQTDLGSDIIMSFDECTPYPATREEALSSMELSMRWAERSKKSMNLKSSLFFGIVQGGMYLDLREKSIAALRELDCDGIAIGGLSVGEPIQMMHEMAEKLSSILPEEKPHYLMGVGTPLDLLIGINHGIDMFDCVIPTRNARNGVLYTSSGALSIKQSKFTRDESALDEKCHCSTCQNYSRAYLRHLYLNNEILASRLHTFHNLFYYHQLIKSAREAIMKNEWTNFFEAQSVIWKTSLDSSEN